MRDGINLARRGIPVVSLVTTAFVAQADFVARAAGMPDVPRVVLPHPLAGTGPAHLREVAADIAVDILAGLRGRP